VKDNISAKVKRILEDWAGESVITDEESTSLMSDLGNLSKVSDGGERIARSLDVDDLGLALANSGADLLSIGSVDDVSLDAIAGQDVAEEVSGRTVHNLRADGVITSLKEWEHSASHSGHTGSESNTGNTVLKLTHCTLELLNSRIANTAIDVTLTLLAEKISTHLSIVKDESGSLEDGEGVGVHAMSLIGTSCWTLTSVDALGVHITGHDD